LKEENVYILDCHYELFIWIGSNAGRYQEQFGSAIPSPSMSISEDVPSSQNAFSGFRDIVLALRTSLLYIDYVFQREKRLTLDNAWVLQSGFEPKRFQAYFPSWRRRFITEARFHTAFKTSICIKSILSIVINKLLTD
jgi:hypothetical protein